MKKAIAATIAVPLGRPLFRGERRLRIGLTGLEGAGTRTIFRAVESASAPHGKGPLAELGAPCEVDIGLDQERVSRVKPEDRDGLLAQDVIVQVIDATALESHLALSVELLRLGRPLVLVLNKMDAAREQGVHVGTRALSRVLGVPVVGAIGAMGYGIRELFDAAIEAARHGTRASTATLLAPSILAQVARRPAGVREKHDWRYWLDEMFLSPRWGLVGSAAIFGGVLYFVLFLSLRIDAETTAPLALWVSAWQPQTLAGAVLRAVADGLVGLAGILVPYMIPLVLVLIALEQSGIMARIAFSMDRFFHRIGLHGDVALPLLLGLGCNVPAISAVAARSSGAERLIASVLVAFVPCSARSAIILALGAKYLGAAGVLALFAVPALVIALLGRLLRRRLAAVMPGRVQEIPAYALPRPRALAREAWERTRDIVTIVTPLLVAGSVVLALMSRAGGDAIVNRLLSPITELWLGLPGALGVPLVFGVLRKELSLAMIYQAIGGFDVSAALSSLQIFVFLLFLTLYVPCISTYAVLARTLGTKRALLSVALSVGVALFAGGLVRFAALAAARLA